MTYDPQHPERGEPLDPGRGRGTPGNKPGQAGHGQDVPDQEPPGQEPHGQEPHGQDLPDQAEPGRLLAGGTPEADRGSEQETRPTPGEQDTRSGPGSYQAARPRERTYQTRGRPRHAQPRKSRRGLVVGAGILGMLALVGLITGLTVAFNQPPSTSGAHLIRTFQFVGSRTSASFNVPSASTSAHYMYRCPKGAANFNARMQNTSGSDVQRIVNTSGKGGTNLVALHPRHPGSAYHLAVHTPCEYRVQVFSK